MQRPQTLDTAYSLAMIREEVADLGRKKDFRSDGACYSKFLFKSALPLPLPLDKTAKPPEPPGATPARAAADKLCNLRQYSRARGLC